MKKNEEGKLKAAYKMCMIEVLYNEDAARIMRGFRTWRHVAICIVPDYERENHCRILNMVEARS
ncbi:MAG: hypothetical protein ACREHG_00025 [Candidatus Saccharimonadales bacterium]